MKDVLPLASLYVLIGELNIIHSTVSIVTNTENIHFKIMELRSFLESPISNLKQGFVIVIDVEQSVNKLATRVISEIYQTKLTNYKGCYEGAIVKVTSNCGRDLWSFHT